MIACVYGTGAAAFVEPVIRDLVQLAEARRLELVGVNLERLPTTTTFNEVSQVYVFPLEAGVADGDELYRLLSRRFPNATVINPPAAHHLSADRVALGARLLERGVPMPETLVTDDPKEVRDFVVRYEHAVLRDLRAAGVGSSLLLVADADRTLVGEARGRRYVVEPLAEGSGRHLEHGVLSVAPPFLVQRMVTRIGRRGVLTPAPVLRAFVADDHVPYWIESYRDRVERPSDFLLTTETKTPRRFLQVVSDEADKLARRALKVVGSPIGAVDLIRSDTGLVVLDVVIDGAHRMIDRSYKKLPEFRGAFDLDRYLIDMIADRLEAQ